MRHIAATAFLALMIAAPAHAQTTQWSTDWELPGPKSAPPGPVHTEQWGSGGKPAKPAKPAKPKRTERWSEGHEPPGPRPPNVGGPGGTGRWAEPSHTKRRSDAEIDGMVGRMVWRAEQDAREGRGAGLDRYQGRGGGDVPDRVWRDHVRRDRANGEFRRREDDHHARQRHHNGN